ncbi:Asp23/Gls24 family envelope stress response protein [Micromonospora sp. NPDC050397]|uniref:Asp23/Gls24 family envelope stress response protein n=1 Tax=Micromonospora sp. NPDC050397 TaxID=3364279 RepID=UPI00384F4410
MADTDTRTDGRDKIKSPAQLLQSGGGQPARAQLTTDSGKTRIAEGVVAKISGFAAREIPGVHSMGSGMARRVGQLRNLVPGGSEASTQGVSVEVGEREAAVDLDIVTWYGQSIVDVSDAVRRNVIDRVQAMTGLNVIEVNINVDDVFVDGDSSGGGAGGNGSGSRAQ